MTHDDRPMTNDFMQALVVEDDADTQANLRDILELDDWRVETAGSVAEVFARRDWSKIALVILDRRLPAAAPRKSSRGSRA
jgi:hypothetical protein